MDNRPPSYGPSITLTGVVGIVLVTLKLTGLIDTSWWWVTAPFWAPFVVGLAVIGIVLIIILTIDLIKLVIRNIRAIRVKLTTDDVHTCGTYCTEFDHHNF